MLWCSFVFLTCFPYSGALNSERQSPTCCEVVESLLRLSNAFFNQKKIKDVATCYESFLLLTRFPFICQTGLCWGVFWRFFVFLGCFFRCDFRHRKTCPKSSQKCGCRGPKSSQSQCKIWLEHDIETRAVVCMILLSFPCVEPWFLSVSPAREHDFHKNALFAWDVKSTEKAWKNTLEFDENSIRNRAWKRTVF